MRCAVMALCLLGLSLPAQVLAEESGKQGAASVDAKFTINYLLYLPKDYGTDKGKKWPVLVFLHGSGERGSDLEKVKIHGPPKIVQSRDLPFIVVSPQCPEGQMWSPVLLSKMLDEVVAKHSVDQDRVYLTGLSMGGFGTWAWAVAEPDRFAALVPICGGGHPLFARRIKHIPVWVFHGAKDEGVKVIYSEEMVEALKKEGANPKFTVYPDAGHDAWTATYENPELYKWLLEQKRQPTEKKPNE